MPIFEYNGKKYNVRDEHIDQFAEKYPDATTVMENEGKKWKVKPSNYNAFVSRFQQPKEDTTTVKVKDEVAKDKPIKTQPITSDTISISKEKVEVNDDATNNNQVINDGEPPKFGPVFTTKKPQIINNAASEKLAEIAKAQRTVPAAPKVEFNLDPNIRKFEEYRTRQDANRQQVKDLAVSIDAELDRRGKELDAEAAKQQQMNIPRGTAMAIPSFNANRTTDPEYREWNAAKRALENAQNIINEADINANDGKGSSFVAGAARGFGQKFFDLNNYDLGMAELSDNAAVLKALDAAENNELSPSQQALLDAKAVELATNAYFGSYVGRGYKAGKVTAESIPFMLEMAINPAKAAGQSLASRLARYALKKFGNKEIVKNGAKYVITKAIPRVAGDIVAASGMTATTGSIRTAADAIDRMSGQIIPGANNNETVFAGRKEGDNMATAISKAFANTTIENYSEMLGEYFAPILNGADALRVNTFSKIGLENVNKFFDDVAASDIAKLISDFEENAKWNGSIGEFAEEIAGGALNAAIVGDQTLDTDEQTGVFNRNNLIDTFLGVSLMGGVISTLKSVGYPIYKYKAANEIDSTKEELYYHNWGDEGIKKITSDLASSDMELVKTTLDAIFDNPSYSDEQKIAAAKYAQANVRYEGVVKAEQKRRNELEAPEQIEVEQSFDNGYTLEGPKEMNDAKNNFDYAEQQVRIALGLAEDENIEEVLNNNPRLAASLEPRIAQDYYNAKATFDGMIQKVNDDISSQMDRSDKMIQSRISQTDSMIHPATLKEDNRQVYIVTGNVSLLNDGTIDTANSDESIIVKDAVTGKAEFTDPSALQNVEAAIDPLEEQIKARQLIRESYAQEAANKIDGVLPFQPNDQYTLIDDQGAQHTATIVSDNGDNTVALLMDNETEPTIATKEEVQQMVDAHNKARLLEFKQQEQVDENAAEATPESPYKKGDLITVQTDDKQIRGSITNINEDGSIELHTETPIQGESNLSTLSVEELNNLAVEKNGQAIEKPAPIPAIERIPVDENGNKQFEAAPAKDSWEALVDMNDGDTAEAMDTAQQMLTIAKKDLEKATKQKAKSGNTIEEIQAIKAERKAQIAQLQSKVDYWSSVTSYPAELEKMKEVEKKINNRVKMEPAIKASQSKGRYAKENADLGEPIDFTDYVMRSIATGGIKFKWSNNPTTNTKGLGAHTGLSQSNKERNSRIWMLDNTNGLYPEEAAEQLLTSYIEEIGYEPNIDTMQALSEIVDVVSSYATPNELFKAVQNRHKQRTEDLARREEEFAISTTIKREQEWQEYLEMLETEILPFFETDYDNIRAIFVEVYQEQENIQNNEQNTTTEGIQREVSKTESDRNSNEGSGNILQAEQSDTAREVQTSDAEQRVDAKIDNRGSGSISASEIRGAADQIKEQGGKVEQERKPAENQPIEESVDQQIKVAEQDTNPQPTEAQKKAGNYKKGHIKIDGFDITIETPKGVERKGVDEKGNPWSVIMNNTYGYIRGTEGVDGDHIDMFLSDNLDNWNGNVYVIDQIKPDGSFDEHKVMYGFDAIEDAQAAYLSNYSEGWKGLGSISGTTKEEFKKWIASSHRKTKPFAEYTSVKTAEGQSVELTPPAAEQLKPAPTEENTPKAEVPSVIRGDKWNATGEPTKMKFNRKGDNFDGYITVGKKKYGRTTSEGEELEILYEDYGNLENAWNAYERGDVFISPNLASIVKAILVDRYGDVKDTVEVDDGQQILFRSGDDVTENSDEYTIEEQQIISNAKADGTYLKAPNGEDTNLTPKQWAQVRTKAFKEWFGDWEKKSLANYLLGNDVVATLSGNEFVKDGTPLSEKVTQYYIEHYNGKVEREGLGEVLLDKRSVKDSASHGLGKAKSAAFAAVPNIITDGRIIYSQTNWKDRGYDSVTIAAPIRIGEKNYVGVVVVKKSKEFNRFYLHEVMIQKSLRDGVFQTNLNVGNPSGDIAKVIKNIINANNSSKIIDTNGEPKVVYHRTPNKFTSFDVAKIGSSTDWGAFGKGFYFSPDAEQYRMYGDKTMALFLNARNPLMLDDKNAFDVKEPFFKDYSWGKDSSEAFTKWVKDNGYDAVVYNDGYKEEDVVFKPNQIKSATDNIGTLDVNNDDIRFRSAESAPVFYSNAEYAVKAVKQEKATPEQWLKMIEKNGGLKAGEDKWLGLSDWLKSSDKKTFSKQEVLDFIKENQIQIEEVEYVENPQGFEELKREYDGWLRNEGYDYAWGQLTDRYGDDAEIAFADLGGELQIDNAEAAATLLGDERSINPTRLDYTTEGLENNKEIALVVPAIESWNVDDHIHFGDAGNGRAIAWVRFGETTAESKESIAASEAVDNYLAEMREKYGTPVGEETDAMSESEISHLQRLTARELNSKEHGERVLVIDEVQSKRHQEGREKGYVSEEVQEAQRQQNYLYKKMHRTGLTMEEYERYYQLGEFIKNNFGIVPPAPFEKNWAELAMKRMLRYAAENGFDKIAWTTGEQQAERYSLGAVMQGLTAYKTSPNSYYVIPYNNGVIGEFVKEYDEKELAETFGKEIAINIITNAENATEENPYEITGDDLRIGVSGMKAFYDQMIPSFMNKYGKKWGVKVQNVTLPHLAKSSSVMHSIDVTDAMRESVMQGQPMFRMSDTMHKKLQKAYDNIAQTYNVSGEIQVAASREEFEQALLDNGVEQDKLADYDKAAYISHENIYLIDGESIRDNVEAERVLFHEVWHKLRKDIITLPELTWLAKSIGSKRLQTLNDVFWGGRYNTNEAIVDELLSISIEPYIEATVVMDEKPMSAFEAYLGNHISLTEATDAAKANLSEEANKFSDVFDKIFFETKRILIAYKNQYYDKAQDRIFQREGEGTQPSTKQVLEDRPIQTAGVQRAGQLSGRNKGQRSGLESKDENNGGIRQRSRRVVIDAATDLAESLGVKINVVEDVNEITDANSAMQRAKRGAKAWYDVATDQVYFVAPNATSVQDAEESVLHEVVAHKGLRDIVGRERFDTFLDKVYRGASEDIRLKIARLAAMNGWNFHVATEEYLASLAEQGFEDRENRTFFEKVRDLFMDMLREAKIILGYDINNNDMRYMLWRTYQMQKSKGVMAAAEDVVMQQKLGVGNFRTRPTGTRPMTEEEQIIADAKANGMYLKAPNGKKSNLTPKQWAQVRTKAFKEWFGDWENDPQNASKVVDRNGEPKVVYNGSKVLHYKYDGRLRTKGQSATNSKVSFFTDNKAVAERYGKFVNEVFLNIQNPYEVDYNGAGWQGWSGAADGMQRASTDSYADLLANGSVDSTLERIIENYGRAEADYLASGSVRNEGVAPDGVIAYNVADPIRSTLYIVRNAEAKDISRNSVTPKGVETFRVLGKASLLFDSQIKSATDNVGTFSKDNDDIRFRITPTSTVPGTAREKYDKAVRTHIKGKTNVGRFENIPHQLQEGYQDSMLGLKKLQEAIETEVGSKIQSLEDAYTAENQLSSKNKAQTEAWQRDYFNPIVKEIAKLTKSGVSYAEIVDYLYAKHGLERNLVFSRKEAEKNEEQWDGFVKRDYSGLTELTGEPELFTEAATQIVEEFETENNTDNLWKVINAATKSSLKKSFDGGLMSKETYENVANMFEYYIPLRGWANDAAEDFYEYIGDSNMKIIPALKTAKGRTSRADDPIATLAVQGESSIIQANRNLMKQKFLNLAINKPTNLLSVSEAWYVKQPDGTWRPEYPIIPENATGDEVDKIIKEFEAKMESYGENATKAKNNLDLKYHTTKWQGQEHAVRVMRNGKEYIVYVNGNPIAAQAVNGDTNPNANEDWLISRAQDVKNLMARAFTSSNPAFIVSNLARDIIWAGTAVAIKENSNYTSRYTQNTMSLFKNATLPRLLKKWSDNTLDPNNETERYFLEFLTNGGETGFTQLNSVDDYKRAVARFIDEANGDKWAKTKKAFSDTIDFFEFFNRSAEDTTRFAVYMTSRQMGRGITESIANAKDITVNFNKKGRGTFGAKYMNLLYIFFNAAVQSLANFGKLLKSNPKKTIAAMTTFSTAGFTAPAIALALAVLTGGDDDDQGYWDLPEWVRRNNLVLYVPFTDNHYITIPLPHEMRAFYGIGELAFSVLMGKETVEDALAKARDGFADMLPLDFTGNGGSLAINFTPTIAQPIAQVLSNTDYFGKPIYRKTPFNELDPEWTKTYKGTNPLLVDATSVLNSISGGDKVESGKIDLNPAIIEHLFEGYVGGLGKTFNKAAKTLSMLWDEDARTWSNVPIASNFYQIGDERTSGSQINREYFDAIDEMKQTEHIYQGYKREQKMGSMEYAEKLSELTNSPTFKRYKTIKKYSEIISDLNKKLKDVDKTDRDSVENAILNLKLEMLEQLEDAEKSETKQD